MFGWLSLLRWRLLRLATQVASNTYTYSKPMLNVVRVCTYVPGSLNCVQSAVCCTNYNSYITAVEQLMMAIRVEMKCSTVGVLLALHRSPALILLQSFRAELVLADRTRPVLQAGNSVNAHRCVNTLLTICSHWTRIPALTNWLGI